MTRFKFFPARAFLALLLGLLIAGHSQGQILKCQGPKGQIEFSNQSCQKGWLKQELALQENTVNHSGAREQTLLQENERLKAELEKARSNAKPVLEVVATSAAAPTEADLPTQRSRSAACDDAARRYEIAAGSIAPVRDLIWARRSTMFATCGIPEPHRVNINTEVHVESSRPCLQWGWRPVHRRSGSQIRYERSCLLTAPI